MKDEHVRDEHLKDAAQDAAEDVTQDVAEDVSGAAEDGSLKVFIVARVICKRRNPGAAEDGSVKVSIVARVIFHACPWVTREGQHMEDAAQDVAEDVLGS